MLNVKEILAKAIEVEASDVHINVGMPPVVRKNTLLITLELPEVSNDNAKEMVMGMIGPDRFKIFEEKRDLDFSTTIKSGHRFRSCTTRRGRAGLVRLPRRQSPSRSRRPGR